ncbi:glycosyltransferase family 2 protein [Caminicella sporogenes]|uniref:glycosyltransferase family 2 protein n=1 Tax=Caminicella sporogenes TaxID=166485 RepID=UPI002540BA35|nr:glycosyltransferase family 2 protein [Caminicella sporogenes]WIF94554.1 glycosyltransferase family 2 protein [Caminicella sporogenes]
MNISVLIPAYNEEKRIGKTIESVKKSRYVNHIVVIDDGSKDDTAYIAKKFGVCVIRLNTNKGKGYALSCGLKCVTNKSDIVVFLDADLGESAIEVDKLIKPLIRNECDVTIAKFKTFGNKKGGFGFVKFLSKKGVKYFTDIDFDNSLSGQRAFKVEVLKKIKKIPKKFGVEVGMTIDILNLGYSIKQVEVDMKHRLTGRDIKGFLHRSRQFYEILTTLLLRALRCNK